MVIAKEKAKKIQHPAKIIIGYMEELGISTNKLAELLGVTFYKAEKIINSEASISADMAIRLERLFNGFDALACLAQQSEFDIQELQRKNKVDYKQIKKFVSKKK